MLECRVEDDGPGIPEKVGDVVFEPGYTSKYDEFEPLQPESVCLM